MTTFYIASSRDRLADVRVLAAGLERRGWRNAFAWHEHFYHRCSPECGIPDRAALARAEIVAASTCDLFIGIARLGKGSHVEIGAALTGRVTHPKRMILVGVVCTDLVFYDAADVEHAADMIELGRLLGMPATRDADLAIAEALEWA